MDKQEWLLTDEEIYQETLLTGADCLEINRLYKSYGNDIFYGDTDSERYSFASGIVTGRKHSKAQLAKVKQQERDTNINHLELLLKHNPIKTGSLRRELGKYVQALKGKK